MKLNNTPMQAITAACGLLSRLFIKAMMAKLISGNKGINLTSCSILFVCLYIDYAYHFNLVNTSVSLVPAFRNIMIKIAKPTATSAAATAMIKNTNTWA